MISWSECVYDLVLKESESLSPTTWIEVTNVPVWVSNQYVVTIPTQATTNRFYRLTLP